MTTTRAKRQDPQVVPDARPCPWCGYPPEIEPWHGGGPRKRMVACSNEYCTVAPLVTGSTRLRALAAWNHREPGDDAPGAGGA